MVTSTGFTKEEEQELTRILGVNERWGGAKVADKLAVTQIDKSFDHPVVSNKVNRNNSTVNDKYIFLIKVFFAVREECFKGNFGITTKGELKQLQSIEKFEKVFMLRFTNSRPQFYSFKKAVELTGLTLEDINNIRAKEDIFNKYNSLRSTLFSVSEIVDLILPEISYKTPKEQLQASKESLYSYLRLAKDNLEATTTANTLIELLSKFINNYYGYSQEGNEGIRFDINSFFELIENSTKEDWDKEIEGLTLFSTNEESKVMADMFYQEKMMELKEHYAFRKLCTYESQRLNPSNIDYANLTTEGKLLPDWYVHFKQNTYFTLLRKEQLVAFFNNYDDRYNNLPADYKFTLEPATQETINAHKSWTNRK
jgi:hypothetical protein